MWKRKFDEEEELRSGLKFRNTEKLFVHKDTLKCARDGCRPCKYKLIIYADDSMLPNQRPEMCPRAKRTHCESSVYVSDMSILTVGDGDFSFSLALAKTLKNPTIVATSHESYESVISTYPQAKQTLHQLKQMKVQVFHGIDATDPGHLEGLGKFDRVVWNFPCVRMSDGADGQNKEMGENKELVRRFYENIEVCLNPKAEIHLTHKTKPPFQHWGIVDLAENAPHLQYEGCIIFDRCLYPGYSNRKVLSKKSFPIWDSQIFVFRYKSAKSSDQIANSTLTNYDEGSNFMAMEETDWVKSNALLSVTDDMLQVIRNSLSKPRTIPTFNKNKRRKRDSKKKKQKPRTMCGAKATHRKPQS